MKFPKFQRPFFYALGFALAALPKIAFGELYLIGEDILAGKNKWKVEGDLSYLSVSDIPPLQPRVSDSSFRGIQTQFDQVTGAMGLRYGLLRDLELSVKTAYEFGWTRLILDGKNVYSEDRSSWRSVSIGFNYQMLKDRVLPAVILFGDIQAAEWCRFPQDNTGDDYMQYLKSIFAGVLIYRRIDPVILSMAAGYSFEMERKAGGYTHKPPNALTLQPAMNFIINSEVSLFMGVSWSQSRTWAYRENKPGAVSTTTRFRAGLNYEVFKNVVAGFSASLNGNGLVYPLLGANFVYDF